MEYRMLKKLTVWLLKRELKQVEHDLMSLSANQDVIADVNLFYNRYESVRKALVLLIEYLE